MPKKGEAGPPASHAQREALKRGQAKRKEMLAKGGETQKERWSRLLDGSLKVEDLDDEEIKRMRVYGQGKAFSGPAPRLPSHLIKAFKDEAYKRAEDQFRRAAPEAVKRLIEIGSDPDYPVMAQIKALAMVLDRALGKVPDKVQVQTTGEFEGLVADAADLLLDRDMGDIPTNTGQPDGTT